MPRWRRSSAGWRAVPAADRYVEYMLYDLAADPYQQVNLAGRVPYQKIADELRTRLIDRNREATDATAIDRPVLVSLLVSERDRR